MTPDSGPSTPGKDNPELEAVKADAMDCVRCDLWTTRTQVVMGEGDPHASIMLVGEGPAEPDDQIGRPFSGRSGAFLDTLLEETGMPRETVYLTNVVRCRPATVKNGQITNRTPRAGEIKACEHWRLLEIDLVDPRVIVCLGGTSAKTLIDRKFKLTEQRGQVVTKDDGRQYIATLHPAYILRLMNVDREAYHAARANLVGDLKLARSLVDS